MAAARDVAKLITDGRRHHAAGRHADALDHYRRALAEAPDDAEAHNLIGAIALQDGDAAAALPHLEAAARQAPGRADIHHHLAEAQRLLGDLDAAVVAYRAALRLQPGQAPVLAQLAACLGAMGRHEEALAAIAEARRIVPADAGFAARHGIALARLDSLAAARDAFAEAAANAPEDAGHHFNLAHMEERLGAKPAAARAYRRAIRLRPGYKEALANLATLMQGERRYDTAGRLFERVLAADPGDVQTLNSIANLRLEEGAPDMAEAVARRAVALDPDSAASRINLGTALLNQGRVAAALDAYRDGVSIVPDDAVAHLNLGTTLLLTGDFENGCREYAWRWKTAGFQSSRRPFAQPPWTGQDLAGKTILVWGEQGVGDEIMMAGLIPGLMARGAAIAVEAEARLAPLFARSFAGADIYPRGVDGAVDPGLAARPIDYQIPSGSLFGHLAGGPDELRLGSPFLVADPARVADLRGRYANLASGLRIGISWYSRNPKWGQRHAALADWRPILDRPGIAVFDLQYGDRRAEREAAARALGIAIHHDDTIDALRDLDAFAAQVAAMDLVVSISNSTVHMAGALGVPCWTLLPQAPYWRWFLNRDDSPWYPSLRLFRQGTDEDSAAVVGRVAAALDERLR
ncbi:MAG: tetratricopeptide repeat protein [Alphaproteobacteria bacterium]|nr:tetratricopeptide repeat protein [Alphaproteobacteria bacterium]